MSAYVGDALLGFLLVSGLGLRGKREDSCLLPFTEPRQKHAICPGPPSLNNSLYRRPRLPPNTSTQATRVPQTSKRGILALDRFQRSAAYEVIIFHVRQIDKDRRHRWARHDRSGDARL